LSPEVVALIERARRELEYGAPRIRVWLRRVHKREVSLAAIQRTFARLGLPRLPRRSRRRPRPRLTLFEKPVPGDSVQQAGIRYGYIKPRHAEQNGKVEHSHRTDQEEFWSRHTFANLESAVAALDAWQHRYNYERFSLALQGPTPAEKLALRLPVAQLA
jgi:hypothetical protein